MAGRDMRKHQRLERPRERVLDEAWALLTERGLGELSLSELGRRLDTSAGHLSYYFGSKNGLLLQLLRRSEGELMKELDEVLASGVPVDERLRELSRLFLPSGAGDPRWLLWVELWPRVIFDPELREAQLELDAMWRDALVGLLAEVTDGDVAPLAQRILAMLDGLGVALLTGEPGLTVDAAWDHVRALLGEVVQL